MKQKSRKNGGRNLVEAPAEPFKHIDHIVNKGGKSLGDKAQSNHREAVRAESWPMNRQANDGFK